MIQAMKTKLKRNKKGFTLAELLIVVAIIAVLIAIAIPVFSAQLNKATDRTIQSNMRSAMSMASSQFLLDGETTAKEYTFNLDTATKNLVLVKGAGGSSGYKVNINSAGTISSIEHPAYSNGNTTDLDPSKESGSSSSSS